MAKGQNQSVHRTGEPKEEPGHNPECPIGNQGKYGGQYGRRVEANRTWTVYHVFTGVPALHNRNAMTGLSRSEATKGMLALNRSDIVRSNECIARPRLSLNEAGFRE